MPRREAGEAPRGAPAAGRAPRGAGEAPSAGRAPRAGDPSSGGPPSPETSSTRDRSRFDVGPDGRGAVPVRVLSYNIRSLRDDRTALARVIRACAPDLLCVQESPRFWRPRQQAAALARATGLYVISGGRSAAGPLLLGRLRVRVHSVHDRVLPRTPGLHKRGFASAVVSVGGSAPFSVTSCHLSLNAEERLAQCRELLRHVAAMPAGPGVVAGDFNEYPEHPGWRLLASAWQDAHAVAPWGGTWTSVPRNPYQRIDAVFCTPEVRVLRCGVPEPLPGVAPADLIAATDHLPLLADLHLPAAGPA